MTACRIFVRDMRFFARHGLLDTEMRVGQLFAVDVEVVLDAPGAAESGSLVDTVDYRRVWEVVHTVMMGAHEDLMERLAYRIAAALLEAPARSVRVQVRKLTPPLGGPTAEVGAEVVLE